MSSRTLYFLSAIVGALVLVGACAPSQSGNVRATSFGARSDVPAPRGRYDQAIVDACDFAPGPSGPDGVLRAPYLQQLGERAGAVLWTSSFRDFYTLELSRPGARIDSYRSQIDPTQWLAHATQQKVELTGLEPSTVYCYSLRAPNGRRTSAGGLRTAPAPGVGARVSFAAFGDSGYGGTDQARVIAQVEQVPLDLMLLTGDIAYPSGSLASYEGNFFDMYASVLSSIPAFPASGNHDYQTGKAEPFREVFDLPENGGVDGLERWYSFDWGDVHFVALDTERVGDVQARWLEEDLTKNELPWTIVLLHRSPYASGAHGSNLDVREAFSAIFEAHRVALVLAGHDHDYERTNVINGVTYVVTGGGGRGTRPVGKSSFTAFSEDVLHFVYVIVEGDDLRMYAIDATGQEFDFAHITRPR